MPVYNQVLKFLQREKDWEQEHAEDQTKGYILKVGKNLLYEYTKAGTQMIRK